MEIYFFIHFVVFLPFQDILNRFEKEMADEMVSKDKNLWGEIETFFHYAKTVFSMENLKTISWFDILSESNSYLDTTSNVNESFNSQIWFIISLITLL